MEAYLAHKEDIDAAVHRVLDSGWYIGGAEVTAFEEEFAAFLGVPDAVGAASGTDALELAMRTLDIGPGDIVATVSHTAVATVAAIELTGAVPVFVDIDPVTFTMCPECLQKTLEEDTENAIKAVIPVHLYGHPADMPAICELAAAHGAAVIEDCAQAHGAAIGDTKTGAWGAIGTFSFYPTKNLGALGDGGAIATTQPALAQKAKLLREYGWEERYISAVPGMNTRLDPIQAAILRVRLAGLSADNGLRRDIASAYTKAFAGTSLCLPTEADQAYHVYHQYVIRCDRRDELRGFLKEQNIGSLIHYPCPVHLQPAYAQRIPLPPGGLPNTEKVCQDILSLPIYPEMGTANTDRVIDAVRLWLAG
ncbi:MAG: DegT/DnrJ/EryC1/StrS family aminotransferase [Lentisphaerae bacterium]|nr:DegT/DnrJ/EryC1/StrS family aminotransferase [Lentisphaerota bacterium]MBT4816543.1 DegT/DnrJ/EryC1/StrS family aminotransferase [Lentisphaerota bacterium]MBT5606183.1 DegT/DnrJ/EryC1/StrS family aminotransferase [Lentisphaerota bacterium]MBT7057871.1 DegT/DnrJ/EryC1/StrS family aminotransferase [Lentisphaerota bacterium]MBT7841735.1 DegT/DnrJ/EryC1/StrS family aminotransferase [Lentisphaerota bacterium]